MKSPQTHITKFISFPGTPFLRAPEGHNLRVTIEVIADADKGGDPLLRDVGRPNWPHRTDQ